MTKAKALTNFSSLTSLKIGPILPATQIAAAKGVAYESAIVIFNSLEQIIQEFPIRKISSQKTGVASWVDNNNNINPYLDVLKLCTSLCLHGLLSNHCDVVVCKILSVSKYIVSKFGARLFSDAVGDSMQDWLRCIVKYANSTFSIPRISACSFLLHLLISYSRYFGSVNSISTILMAIFGEVVTFEIINGESIPFLVLNNKTKSRSFNADSTMGPLKLSLIQITEVISKLCQNRDCNLLTKSSGLFNITRHIHSCQNILQAYIQLRNFFEDYSNSAKDKILNGGDIDRTIELCYEAVNTFDSTVLPKYKIRWLNYIGRLNALQGNAAEHAETLWRIFLVVFIHFLIFVNDI